MLGSEGNDLLLGDIGNDMLIGGSGADIFEWKDEAIASLSATNNGVNPLGSDAILDFIVGLDKLRFEQRLFPTLNPFALTTVATFDSTSSSSTVVYESNSGKLFYNPTAGAGDEVLLVTLQANLALTSADIG